MSIFEEELLAITKYCKENHINKQRVKDFVYWIEHNDMDYDTEEYQQKKKELFK